jgi:hypothetical protein
LDEYGRVTGYSVPLGKWPMESIDRWLEHWGAMLHPLPHLGVTYFMVFAYLYWSDRSWKKKRSSQ